MDSNGVQGRRYRLVLRGELGDAFGILFDSMQLRRLTGMTVLTGQVTDQAHLAGLIEQIQELGAELISVTPDQGNGRRCSGSRDRTRLVMMAHRHALSEPSPAGPSPSSSCTGSALAVRCSRSTTPSSGSRVLAEIGEDHIYDSVQAAVAASNGPAEQRTSRRSTGQESDRVVDLRGRLLEEDACSSLSLPSP